MSKMNWYFMDVLKDAIIQKKYLEWIMKIGKVNETILKRSIMQQLKNKRPEVVLGPKVGEDCAMVQFSPNELCVLSSDPITGATKGIGQLAVHVTVNDLAANGAEPIGLMMTMLLPEGFEEDDLKTIMQEIEATCIQLDIQVLGGHTEVTKAVNQAVLISTGVGKASKATRIINQEATEGMDIIMTKWAGLEGTAIIAAEKEAELRQRYHSQLIDDAINMKAFLSVLPESRIALKYDAAAMHDATEGGVFGALWELGASANLGLEVHLDKIPIQQATIEICEFYDLNPYKLISSGVMLIISPSGDAMVGALNEAGIDACIIGKTRGDNQRVVIQEDTIRSLQPAKADELYKVI